MKIDLKAVDKLNEHDKQLVITLLTMLSQYGVVKFIKSRGNKNE